MANAPKDAKYPDAIAVAFDEINNKLTCVYNDHSLYIWDVRNIKRVRHSLNFVFAALNLHRMFYIEYTYIYSSKLVRLPAFLRTVSLDFLIFLFKSCT